MRLSPRWLLAAAVVLVVVFAYPGYLDATGLAQLRLIQRWRLSPDAYGFALLWRATAIFVAGPFGMVLAQVALFTYGAQGLLRRAVGEKATAFTALLLVMPPVLVGLSTVSPSALTAALLMTAVGTERTWVRRTALVLAVMCTPLAALAAIPLLVKQERLTLGGALLALGAVAMFVNVDSDLARADLVGMGARVDPPPAVDVYEPYAHRAKIVEARNAAARANVGAYVSQRAETFAAVLGVASRETTSFVPSRERADDERRVALKLGVSTGTSLLQRALIAVLGLLAYTPLLWPVLYVLLAIGLTIRDRSQVPMLLSGLLLEATLIVSAISASPASSLWLVSTALLVLLMGRRR